MLRFKPTNKIDFILILVAFFIFLLGLAFLYSASYQQVNRNFLVKQIIWFALSVLIGLVILAVNYQKWLDLAYPLYAINLILLILVLLIGQARFGAQRWITFGNVGFQPSEFSKLIIILTLARYLGQRKAGLSRGSSRNKDVSSPKVLLVAFSIVLLPFMLIVKQPDLGTALVLVPILFTLLFVWGLPWRTLFLILGSVLLGLPLFWQLLKDYQQRRILVFINPNLDPLGAGYTIIQSKIAIGSGRLLGKGWLAGTQNQLNFLPERHTDFIFSVVGEEWGLLGAMLLLVLYFILIWRAFAIAEGIKNFSAKLLVSGIIVLISFQTIINIAMTMGLVPVVGLPLPLISYGGSSLLTTMIAIAFVLNIGIRR